MRAFCALIVFVIVVYLTELLVGRAILPEPYLRLEWVGITMVPAAQYHLSDALLSTTGALPRRRKYFVAIGYLISLVFLGLVVWTDLIAARLIGGAVPIAANRVPHLEAGPLFPLFALYYWLATAASIYNVWRARQRCITSTTRNRMTTTLMAFLAAPLGVFPYLVIGGNASRETLVWLLPLVIIGNLVVALMFALLTSHLAYFGTVSPDRVVRVRLYKFMARVPLAGTIVLLVFILVSRSSEVLGLPTETALGFALVATVMLVEWAIHAYKRPLERLFQLNDDPDVRRIQKLSERLLTTSDLRQFLESVLATTCEVLRTPTAFVAAITADGPKLESVVGPLAEPESIWQDADLKELAQAGLSNDGESGEKLETVDDFILWQDYWIRPLYNRKRDVMLGIFGIRRRAETPDLQESEQDVLEKLIGQAEAALEDRLLQQQVFAAVETLLPEITALQERRGAATFEGLPVFTAAEEQEEILVDDPKFNTMVRDALSHYWGGPKLSKSPLLRLQIVQEAMIQEHANNPTSALRSILARAIELQKPEGERSMTTAEWILYNILELKFVQGKRVRDVAMRLAMSESDLYRKQRVAIENVARTVANMESNNRNKKNDDPT